MSEANLLDRFVKSQGTDERVCVWPDGDWCYECELSDMGHKSDDWQFVPATDAWSPPRR